MRGVPTSQQDLEVNEDGYYVYGQNIKRQYDFKVLWDKGYLHGVDSRKPLIAYTSSVGEVGVINESFYRTGDNGAFQGLIQKDTTNHTEYGTIYLLTVLKKLFIQFGYNTSMRLILDLELELPVLTPEDTTPYWDYMAYFIYNIQQQYADQLEAKSEYELNLMCQILGVTREEVSQRVAYTQPQYTNTFRVGDLFEPKLGVNVSKDLILTEGKNRLVSGTTTNNGTIGYIEEDIKGHTYKEGVTVSNRGEYSGRAFYQPTEFILGPNVIYLEPKIRVTQEFLLYIVALVNKLPYGGYDNYPTKSGIVEDVLELPVLAPNSKEIDWGAIRHAVVGGGGVNYLATRMEICNRNLAIIRQLLQ